MLPLQLHRALARCQATLNTLSPPPLAPTGYIEHWRGVAARVAEQPLQEGGPTEVPGGRWTEHCITF